MFENFEEHVRKHISTNYSDKDFFNDLSKGADRKKYERKKVLWVNKYAALNIQLDLLIHAINAQAKLYDIEENVSAEKFYPLYRQMPKRYSTIEILNQRDADGVLDIVGGIEYFSNEDRNIRNFNYFSFSENERFLKEVYKSSDKGKSEVESLLRGLYKESHSDKINSLFSAGAINTVSYLYTLNLLHHIFNAEEIPDHLMIFIDFAAVRVIQESGLLLLKYFRAGEKKSKLLHKNINSKRRMLKRDPMIIKAYEKKKKDSWNEPSLPRTTKRRSVARELTLNGLFMSDRTLDRALKRLQESGLISGY